MAQDPENAVVIGIMGQLAFCMQCRNIPRIAYIGLLNRCIEVLY